MAGVLESLVIDTESDHNTQETARRVAKMFLTEVFKGRYHAMPAVTEFPNIEQLNELLIVGPITARSACSHHFCPILGKVWIGIMPNEHSNLIGLSKYARICDWVMSRRRFRRRRSSSWPTFSGEGQAGRARDRDRGRPLLHALARQSRPSASKELPIPSRH